MRQAGLAVWQAHDLVSQQVVPGATTAQLNAKVADYFAKTDVTPLFLDYPNASEGKPPFPAVICTSVNDEVVHGIPNDRPLEAGDIVSVDIGGKLNGWCGDAACTYAVGQLAPEAEKLLNVTRETLELAVELMKKKSMWSEVAGEMGSYV